MIMERLVVQIDADVSRLETGVAGATRSVRKLGDEAAKLGRTLTAAVSLPIAGIGVAAVSASVKMDSLTRGLEVSAGSAEAAGRQLEELDRIARLPGLGFAEAISGAVTLNTVLKELPDTIGYSNRLLEQFGNTIALTGGGKSELDRVIFQLGQIAASGKVLTQDLRPIITTAPAVAGALRAAFGTIDAQQIEKLGLSSQEFFDRLLEGLEGLPRAAGGARNAFENFTDALFKARVEVGDKLLPVLRPLLERTTELLESIESLSPAAVGRWVGLGAALFALGPSVAIVGKLTTGIIAMTAVGNVAAFFQLAAGVRSLSAAFALLTAAIPGAALIKLGIGALSLALSGLFGWWVKNKVEAAGLRDEIDRVTASTQRFTKAITEMTGSQVTAEIAAIEAQLANLRAVQGQVGSSPGLGFVVGSGFGAESVQADIDRLEARLEKLRAGLDVPVTVTGVGAVNTAGLELGRLLERVGSLQDKLIDLRHDAALATTTEDAAKFRKEILDTESALRRVNDALRDMGIDPGFAELLAKFSNLTRAPEIKLVGEIEQPPAVKHDVFGRLESTRLDLSTAAVVSSIFPEEAVDRLELSLLKLRVASDEAWAGLKNIGSGIVSGIGDFARGLLDTFNPLKIIATVFNQALREAVGAMQPLIDAVGPLVATIAEALAPAFEALAPVIQKLSPAIASVATLFSGLIVAVAPILEALIPVLNLVVRAFSYLVSGIGYLIRAIGDIILAIPSWLTPGWVRDIGRGLEDFGQGMIDAGANARDALDRTADGANGAADAIESMTASLTNVPEIFDYALRRRLAAIDGAAPPPTGGGGGGGDGGGDGGDPFRPNKPGGPIAESRGVTLHVNVTADTVSSGNQAKRTLLKVLKDPEVQYHLRVATS